MNIEGLLSVASKVGTPLALSGIIVIVLYAIYKQVLALKLFAPIGAAPTSRLLQNVLNKLFWLALVALILGVTSYIITAILPRSAPSHSSNERALQGIAASRDVLVNASGGVMHTGQGSVYVTNIQGISKEEHKRLAALPGMMVPIQHGTIIATHYPTGELFAVEPKSGALRLLSARLGNPVGLAIRSNGEVIVLAAESNPLKLPQQGSAHYRAHIIGVNPDTGYHRNVGYYHWPFKARALALESENFVLVALDGALIRVDLESGQFTLVASGDLLRGASGVVQLPSGEIVVTTIPDKVLKVDSTDGSTVVLSEGNRLWYPRAPTVENVQSVLVGTARGKAGESGVLRVNLQTGAQDLIATGPFTTIAGMAIESDGSILIADNGRGQPGDGFLARLDPTTRQTIILVSAQSSNWKFVNGRSVAIFPKASPS